MSKTRYLSSDILKTSVWYTLLGFLPLLFSVVFTPIYLKYLGKAEYGVLSLFMAYVGIGSRVFSLGVSESFGFYYWDYHKDPRKLKEFIARILGLMLVVQLVLVIPTLLFGEQLLELLLNTDQDIALKPFLYAVIILSSSMVYYEMFLYLFRNEGNIKSYAVLSLAALIGFTILTLLFVVIMNYQAQGAIYGRTIGFALSAFIVFVMVFKRYGIRLNVKFSISFLAFSFPLFINSIIGAISFNIDRLMIERLASLNDLGVYGFALVIVSIVEIFFKSLNNALSPSLYKMINDDFSSHIQKIKSLSYLIVFSSILIALTLLCVLYPIFYLLIPEKFHDAALFLPILLPALIWRILSTLKSYPIYSSKKNKLMLFNQSSYLVFVVVFSYLLYDVVGLLGIAFAVYLARIGEYGVMYFLSKRASKLNFNFQKLIITTVVVSVVCFLVVSINWGIPNYILFFIPLITFLICLLTLLRKEMRLSIWAIKNRKLLFS